MEWIAWSSNTQVLIYNGQLDIIVGAPLTERYLGTVPWYGAIMITLLLSPLHSYMHRLYVPFLCPVVC